MTIDFASSLRLALALWPLLFFGGCLTGLSGCNTIPTAFPQEFAVAAKQIATSVATQAAWRDITAGLRGQVISPGIKTYAGMLYVAGAELPGVSGQIDLGAKGEGAGPLSDEGRAAILMLANQYNVSPEQVAALLAALRGTPAPGAPLPMTPVPVSPVNP